MIDYQTALIYTMVLASASDAEMTDKEIRRIGHIISNLPVFEGFDPNELPTTVGKCADLLDDENGLEKAFGIIKESLPKKLRETAYALACDVVVVDGDVQQEELRLLEMARHELAVDRLAAAGIERGASARFATYSPEED
ncbi:MAG: tellurite resistance TerB family protein [Rhodospirillales bacterium]|jgi:tellurite resistance protein|nr:tellurite resistance TerB family protein [Rhodospirillales bacterium]